MEIGIIFGYVNRDFDKLVKICDNTQKADRQPVVYNKECLKEIDVVLLSLLDLKGAYAKNITRKNP
jgi:hypothetical protein